MNAKRLNEIIISFSGKKKKHEHAALKRGVEVNPSVQLKLLIVWGKRLFISVV